MTGSAVDISGSSGTGTTRQEGDLPVQQSVDTGLATSSSASVPSPALQTYDNNESGAASGPAAGDTRSTQLSPGAEEPINTADSAVTACAPSVPSSDQQVIRKGRFIVENVDPAVIESGNAGIVSSAQVSICSVPSPPTLPLGADGMNGTGPAVVSTISGVTTSHLPEEDRPSHQHPYTVEGEVGKSAASASQTVTSVQDHKMVAAAPMASRTPSPTIIISVAGLVGAAPASAPAGGTLVGKASPAVSTPVVMDDQSLSTGNVTPATSTSQPATPSENGPEVTKKGRFVVINSQAPVIQGPIGLVSGPMGVSPVAMTPLTSFSGTVGVVAASTTPVPVAAPLSGATASSVPTSVHVPEPKEHEDTRDMQRNDAGSHEKVAVERTSHNGAVQSEQQSSEATKTETINPNAAAVAATNPSGSAVSHSSAGPVTKPESSVQTSNSTSLHVRSVSRSAASPATSVADRGGFSSFEIKKGYNLGKVYHFLDEIKQEVQEVDKLNRVLQNDMKFFRDKNKELEARNRELEKKLLEERTLRENADSKLIQMKKKMAELKRVVATMNAEKVALMQVSSSGGLMDQQSETLGSPKKFYSCDNIKAMANSIFDDHPVSDDIRTHRKASSLFCPTLTSDGAARRRANSISDVEEDIHSSSGALPPSNTAAKPSNIQKVGKKETYYLRPPLPSKQRGDIHESMSSAFSDLIDMSKMCDSEFDASGFDSTKLAKSQQGTTLQPLASTKGLNAPEGIGTYAPEGIGTVDPPQVQKFGGNLIAASFDVSPGQAQHLPPAMPSGSGTHPATGLSSEASKIAAFDPMAPTNPPIYSQPQSLSEPETKPTTHMTPNKHMLSGTEAESVGSATMSGGESHLVDSWSSSEQSQSFLPVMIHGEQLMQQQHQRMAASPSRSAPAEGKKDPFDELACRRFNTSGNTQF